MLLHGYKYIKKKGHCFLTSCRFNPWEGRGADVFDKWSAAGGRDLGDDICSQSSLNESSLDHINGDIWRHPDLVGDVVRAERTGVIDIYCWKGRKKK